MWFLPTLSFLSPPQPPHSSLTTLLTTFNVPSTLFWIPHLGPPSIYIQENQVELPDWRQRALTLETFFLKQSKKQMALQSTGIALGWKFKMH